ncbi:hypothetical protein GCM10027075_27000 [Streptomyces heilongjiangensis]
MNDTPTLDDLRNQLVDEIVAKRPLPAPIEHALRTVRRDLHLPGLDPAAAYTNRAVTIKDNPNGPLALSCASVPSTVAMMLAQLAPQPGDRILEIGAGTGYNAALLAELVGPTDRSPLSTLTPESPSTPARPSTAPATNTSGSWNATASRAPPSTPPTPA